MKTPLYLRQICCLTGLLLSLAALSGCAHAKEPLAMVFDPAVKARAIALLPDEYRAMALDGNKLKDIAIVASLPPSVRALLPAMANPGRPWNSTDVVTDESLLFNRLLWAGANGEVYFIYYEHGGIGYNTHVVVITLPADAATAKITWEKIG